MTFSADVAYDPRRSRDDDGEAVRAWQRAQTAHTAASIARWPHGDALRDALGRAAAASFAPLPRRAGASWFRIDASPDHGGPIAIVSATPLGDGRIVDDPRAAGETDAAIMWLAPSPDGSVLALGICTDGSETNTIRLVDVATSRRLDDAPRERLLDAMTGGVHWLPDASGLFFIALDGEPSGFRLVPMLHRRGGAPRTEPLTIPAFGGAPDYRCVTVARDGSHAIAYTDLITTRPVALARLDGGPLCWRPFVTRDDCTLYGHVAGDAYVAITDLGAVRRRLIAIPLDASDPNDDRAWRELIPEGAQTLRGLYPVADGFCLTAIDRGRTLARFIARNGASHGTLTPPFAGAIGEAQFAMPTLYDREAGDGFLFAISAPDVAPALALAVPGKDVEVLRGPAVRLNDVVVTYGELRAADGAPIGYTRAVKRDAVDATPTLVYAYGASTTPLMPSYAPAFAAFLEAGGAVVHAHLRGGIDIPVARPRAGRSRFKQQTYDDLYVLVEALVARGLAPADGTALVGRSNGGLLVLNAAIQRPDLWAACAAIVPVGDLLDNDDDAYGAMCVAIDHGNPEDPASLPDLAAISPYQAPLRGGFVPPLIVCAADGDFRCRPATARRVVARLQDAPGGPVLLHLTEGGGHGPASRSVDKQREEFLWLAFVMQRLGMTSLSKRSRRRGG